ncbi:hypothetical protein RW1_038_00940 [Rhodococcus wratislaviensis NBRC 100605]|uniref:Uncharacterized protein n=1 Tax=Rhodococcus wratislaviensis NBRC 100605 TaxID=1219028 RepID=X0Q6Z7_RHOWR|nr:hypothetical protein RW1_038_00940 [Rhodococcus wratislaviensis NBRC 100605]
MRIRHQRALINAPASTGTQILPDLAPLRLSEMREHLRRELAQHPPQAPPTASPSGSATTNTPSPTLPPTPPARTSKPPVHDRITDALDPPE